MMNVSTDERSETDDTILNNRFIQNADVEVLEDGSVVLTHTQTIAKGRSANSNTTEKQQGKIMLVLEEAGDAEVVAENIALVKRNEKVIGEADDLLDPVPVLTRSGGSQYKYADGAYSCTIESTITYIETTVYGKLAASLTQVSGGVKNLPVGATGNGGYVRIGQAGTTVNGYKEQIRHETLSKYDRSFIFHIDSSWLPVHVGSPGNNIGAQYSWDVISGSTVKNIYLSNNLPNSLA